MPIFRKRRGAFLPGRAHLLAPFSLLRLNDLRVCHSPSLRQWGVNSSRCKSCRCPFTKVGKEVQGGTRAALRSPVVYLALALCSFLLLSRVVAPRVLVETEVLDEKIDGLASTFSSTFSSRFSRTSPATQAPPHRILLHHLPTFAVFLTATVVDVIGISFARNRLKRELCSLLLYINTIALLHYLQLGSDSAPSLSCSGRPMRHGQYLEWCFTTPVFVFLAGQIGGSKTPILSHTMRIAAAADVAMIIFGHAGTFACAPYKWILLACSWACLVVVLSGVGGLFAAGKNHLVNSRDIAVLDVLHGATIVLWNSFGVARILGELGAYSFATEDVILTCVDCSAKVMYSVSLLVGHIFVLSVLEEVRQITGAHMLNDALQTASCMKEANAGLEAVMHELRDKAIVAEGRADVQWSLLQNVTKRMIGPLSSVISFNSALAERGCPPVVNLHDVYSTMANAQAMLRTLHHISEFLLLEEAGKDNKANEGVIGGYESTSTAANATAGEGGVSALSPGMRQGLANSEFNAMDLPDELVSLAGPKAMARGVDMVVDFAPALHLFQLWGDANRLRQVLLHLIDNGIEYNRPGGELVVRADIEPQNRERERNRECERDCKSAPEAYDRPDFHRFRQPWQSDCDGSVMLVITIADSGIGLSPVDCKAAFMAGIDDPTEFGEFLPPVPVPMPGAGMAHLGLGLTISRHTVARMGGTLRAASEIGVGTFVQVSLPFSCRYMSGCIAVNGPQGTMGSPAPAAILHPTLPPMRVIVSMDRPALQRIVCTAVRGWGAHPFEVQIPIAWAPADVYLEAPFCMPVTDGAGHSGFTGNTGRLQTRQGL